MSRAVLLDRDGTIIVDKHYLADPAGVELERGAVRGLARMRALGLLLICVTNQSGVAKGLFDRARVDAVNARVDALLACEGVTIDGWYVCPHGSDSGCDCRKPAPGLALAAAREFGLDLSRAFVIGDKLSDVELARAVGARGILVETGKGAALAGAAREAGFSVARDLDGAADLIAAHGMEEKDE